MARPGGGVRLVRRQAEHRLPLIRRLGPRLPDEGWTVRGAFRHPSGLLLREGLPCAQHARQCEQVGQHGFGEAADRDELVAADAVDLMEGIVADQPDRMRPVGELRRDPVLLGQLFDPIVERRAGEVGRVQLGADVEGTAVGAGGRFLHVALDEVALGRQEGARDRLREVVRYLWLRRLWPDRKSVPTQLPQAVREVAYAWLQLTSELAITDLGGRWQSAVRASQMYEVPYRLWLAANRVGHGNDTKAHPLRQTMRTLMHEGRHV